MSNYLNLFKYFFSDLFGFFSFVTGRIPFWVLFLIFIYGKISEEMFWSAFILIIFSRVYFDTVIFGKNPLLGIFSILFYSFSKPVLYLGIFFVIVSAVACYLLWGNFYFLLLPMLLAGVTLAGFDIFFRKDYLNALWTIKNLPAYRVTFLSDGLLILSWVLVISTPVYISVMGLLIIYIIELKKFYLEIESII